MTFPFSPPGGAGICARTDREPDLRCTAQVVGSTYVGGVMWTTLAGANRVSELTPGSLAAADGLFRCDRAPWPVFYF